MKEILRPCYWLGSSIFLQHLLTERISGGKSAWPETILIRETSSNRDKPLEFMITFKRPGKMKLNPNKKIAAKDYRAMAEEITLERQVEFSFPEGIRDLKAAYDKRLPPGKYLAEVSFQHGDKTLISQSLTFRVESVSR